MIGVFAIYEILLSWKTCKYYHETDEPSNPGPGQPKKEQVEVAFGPLFPTANNFSWVRIGFILETDYKKLNRTNFFSAYTPLIGVCVVHGCFSFRNDKWVWQVFGHGQ